MSEQLLKSFRAQIVTMSDSRSSGERRDTVGPMLTEKLREHGATARDPVIVPDEKTEIIRILIELADSGVIDLIITTGGTGLTPRDVTPDATKEVITREIPGISEFIRHEGGQQTSKAYLSRGITGIRGCCMIVNIPGSERGAMQSLDVLLPIIPHALETIRGESSECGKKIGDKDHAHTH